MKDIKHMIARRAAQELREGDIVNLGIGIPTLVGEYIPNEINIFIHSENGLLGLGPSPAEHEIDPDLINAGRQPVTAKVGASYFSSDQSFAMIRGGHIDVAILGALQVDEKGRVANWSIPGQAIQGVGGAMDLLVGAKRIVVTMNHTTRDGEPKIVGSSTLPLTAERPINIIITELAVFHVIRGKLILKEIMPGATLEEIKNKTTAKFIIDLK